MNKGRRNELAALKRKKRVKLYKVDGSQRWTHKLKNHATLCSCMMCKKGINKKKQPPPYP